MEFPGMPPACSEAGTGAGLHALLAAALLDLHFLQRQNYLSFPPRLSQDFLFLNSWHSFPTIWCVFVFITLRKEYYFFFFFLHFKLRNLYPHHCSEISNADLAAFFISWYYPFSITEYVIWKTVSLQSDMWRFWAHQCKCHSSALDSYAPTLDY